jgi:preprotein translocase subunit YajC
MKNNFEKEGMSDIFILIIIFIGIYFLLQQSNEFFSQSPKLDLEKEINDRYNSYIFGSPPPAR